MALTEILWTVLIFLLSALPLHIAVRMMGGKTNLLKTAIVSLIAGLAVGFIRDALNFWGGLVAFILMIWIYREAFKLKWIKALLAWLLQFVVIFFFALLLGLLLGIGLAAMFVL